MSFFGKSTKGPEKGTFCGIHKDLVKGDGRPLGYTVNDSSPL